MQRDESERAFQEAGDAPAEAPRTEDTVLNGDVLVRGPVSTPGAAAAKSEKDTRTAKVGVSDDSNSGRRHHDHHPHHSRDAATDEKPLTAETEGWWRWTWRNLYNGLVAMSQTFYTAGEAVSRRQAPDVHIIETNNKHYWAAPPTEAELKKQARRQPSQSSQQPHQPLPSQIPEGVDNDDDDSTVV